MFIIDRFYYLSLYNCVMYYAWLLCALMLAYSCRFLRFVPAKNSKLNLFLQYMIELLALYLQGAKM